MHDVRDDPYWLDRWLLPDLSRESEVFETMLEAVEGRLASVRTAWKALQDEPGWPDGAEDSLVDEGTSAEAMRIDIAEIALTAVLHWIERRCTLVLLRKSAARHDDAAARDKLARATFEAKMKALAAMGVDVESQPYFALINEVLREFANSWKHRDHPKRELLAALELEGEIHQPIDLLKDDAVREAMAWEVASPGMLTPAPS